MLHNFAPVGLVTRKSGYRSQCSVHWSRSLVYHHSKSAGRRVAQQHDGKGTRFESAPVALQAVGSHRQASMPLRHDTNLRHLQAADLAHASPHERQGVWTLPEMASRRVRKCISVLQHASKRAQRGLTYGVRAAHRPRCRAAGAGRGLLDPEQKIVRHFWPKRDRACSSNFLPYS